MGVKPDRFFKHVNDFFNYRTDVYEASPQTIRTNRIDLGLFETFIYSQNIKSINGPAIIDFQYYLKKQRQNSGASINRKIFALRSYGNYLKLYDVPRADTLPFYDVLKIRQGYRKRPGALTPKQIGLLFKAIDCQTILGIRDYAVYALMYQLGLRVGEVHSINLDDIDFENSKLNVIGKGNKPRTLHINDELVEILSHYISVRKHIYNSCLTPALFVSKKGNRLAIRTMEDNFKNIVFYSSANAPFNITCHTLRHSMASHLNDNNVDILIIQSILGHSSARSTEPYIHPSFESIRRAMEKLPGVKYVKELIRKGEIVLRFQKRFKPKLE
jgi:site-specific recombinase XerD